MCNFWRSYAGPLQGAPDHRVREAARHSGQGRPLSLLGVAVHQCGVGCIGRTGGSSHPCCQSFDARCTLCNDGAMAAVSSASSTQDLHGAPIGQRLRRPKLDHLAVVAYALAGVSLVGMGTGVLGIFPAPVTVALGIIALVRLNSASEHRRGRGLVIASIVIGLAVTTISLIMILGSQAV